MKFRRFMKMSHDWIDGRRQDLRSSPGGWVAKNEMSFVISLVIVPSSERPMKRFCAVSLRLPVRQICLSPRSFAPTVLLRFSLSSLRRLKRLMRPKIAVKL